MCGQTAPIFALHERRNLVAEAEDAARLKPDEGNFAREERRERGDAARRFASRLLDETYCQESAPAAERPLPIGRLRQVHAVTGGGEHGERRLDVLWLEVAVECVGKENDHSRPCAAIARRLAPYIGTPARQVASRAQPHISLRPLSQARRVVAHIGKFWPLGRERRVPRQVPDQPLAQREPTLGQPRRLRLDLHTRDVDAGRAFAPARLAGNAKLQGLRHLIGSERVRPELTCDGKPQGVGAPARDVALVAGDAIAGAHDAAGKRAARAVVVAHLDRALETAAGAGIGGPVEVRADLLRPVVRPVAEEGPIVEFRRAHDLPRIVKTPGVEALLELFEGAHETRPEHFFVEFRTHDAVAVLAGVRALVGAHQRERLLGDGAHRLGVFLET